MLCVVAFKAGKVPPVTVISQTGSLYTKVSTVTPVIGITSGGVDGVVYETVAPIAPYSPPA